MTRTLERKTEAVGPPRRYRWTRDAYERLAELGLFGEKVKIELIEGDLITEGMTDRMSPQLSRHSTAVVKTERALRAAFGEGYYVRYQMPLSLGADTEPEPDIVVAPGSPDDYMEHHPTTALLVVEIAESTLRFDRRHKAGLYARAGIPEYWIVNLVDHTLEVRRDPGPLPDRPFGYVYGQTTILAKGGTVRPLGAPDAEIRVADIVP